MKNLPYDGCIWVRNEDGSYEGCLNRDFNRLSIIDDENDSFLIEFLVYLDVSEPDDTTNMDPQFSNSVFQFYSKNEYFFKKVCVIHRPFHRASGN